jgi:translation elongation factor EF-Ts
VNPQDIKWLRDKTGHSVLSCRDALLKANNNKEAALKILHDKTRESMRRFGGILDG